MTKVLSGITVSVDGYVAGPNDVAGNGLGDGGERLHYWVFGGPWTYENEPEGEATGEDAAWLKEMTSGSAQSSPAAGPTRRRTTGATRIRGTFRSSSSRTVLRSNHPAMRSSSSQASVRQSTARGTRPGARTYTSWAAPRLSGKRSPTD